MKEKHGRVRADRKRADERRAQKLAEVRRIARRLADEARRLEPRRR